MKTVDIVERIEGEAKLNLSWRNGCVEDARIDFLNFRGYEYILENKPLLDALVYTPRICGICGQAHLLATVQAIESVYKNANLELEVSNKAKILRELGLAIEIMDSHIKWFYMFIMPDIMKASSLDESAYQALKGKKWLKAQKAVSELMKALALYAGQWPHTSYMIPGGVVSDPTHLDITMMKNYLDQTIRYFEQELSGVSLDHYLSFSSMQDLFKLKADLKDLVNASDDLNLNQIGKSYDRHLSLGSMFGMNSGKIKNKNVLKVDLSRVKESDESTFELNVTEQKENKHTWAKSVQYADNFYEVGPLSRALVNQRRFIKSIHKQFDDSVLTRVLARMDELAYLLNYSKKMLEKLDLSEPSFIKPKQNIKNIDYAQGEAVVEACRGSLIHSLEVKNGVILSYDVITPTVWNLSSHQKSTPGVAQKAIQGSKTADFAKIILRSFDVCSVCTTH